jgi:hypothetical protein
MMETSTHQDHVIAHVIGATPLGYFIWDETAFILLDIGFIWNIYLDMEMGLLPHSVVIAELEAEDSIKNELRSQVDLLLRSESSSPIDAVEMLEWGEERRLVLVCEGGNVTVETSLEHRWTRINADKDLTRVHPRSSANH